MNGYNRYYQPFNVDARKQLLDAAPNPEQ